MMLALVRNFQNISAYFFARKAMARNLNLRLQSLSTKFGQQTHWQVDGSTVPYTQGVLQTKHADRQTQNTRNHVQTRTHTRIASAHRARVQTHKLYYYLLCSFSFNLFSTQRIRKTSCFCHHYSYLSHIYIQIMLLSNVNSGICLPVSTSQRCVVHNALASLVRSDTRMLISQLFSFRLS